MILTSCVYILKKIWDNTQDIKIDQALIIERHDSLTMRVSINHETLSTFRDRLHNLENSAAKTMEFCKRLERDIDKIEGKLAN